MAGIRWATGTLAALYGVQVLTIAGLAPRGRGARTLPAGAGAWPPSV